jgi:hypothetical protein
VPFKANADRRHRIPRQRHRVMTNWSEYDAALRARGSLTVWFTAEAIEAWRAEPRTTRGGQPRYSALAVMTALTLRAVFRLALRQTEGLIASILHLLGLDLPVPDPGARPSDREPPGGDPGAAAGAVGPRTGAPLLVDSTGLRLCGPGEWLIEKHGSRTRRSRKGALRPHADPCNTVDANSSPFSRLGSSDTGYASGGRTPRGPRRPAHDRRRRASGRSVW